MATIYWRGDRAYLNWSEGGEQQRRSLGQISERDAEKRRKAKEVELESGKKLDIYATSERFGSIAVRYLDWHALQFPDSHARVRFIISKRFTHFHDRPIGELSQFDIESWVAVRSKKVAPATVEKELRTLKAFLNKALEWKSLVSNPAEHVQAPKDVKSEPIHWYTQAELQRLYAADPRHCAVWQFLANTGLRRREAMQLKWKDIRDGSVWVVSREGARTKSARWREVPLSPGAMAALSRLEGSDYFIGPRRPASDYVLPRITGESWSRAFAGAIEAAKLGGSLHSLRHSFAANLVLANVSLRVVQRLMGHASIKTTEQYAHVSKGSLQVATAMLTL
jgi:integrase